MRLILISSEHFVFGLFHSFIHYVCVCVCKLEGGEEGSLSCHNDDSVSEGGQRKRSWKHFENCQLRILLELFFGLVFIVFYTCRKSCNRLRAPTKLIYVAKQLIVAFSYCCLLRHQLCPSVCLFNSLTWLLSGQAIQFIVVFRDLMVV